MRKNKHSSVQILYLVSLKCIHFFQFTQFFLSTFFLPPFSCHHWSSFLPLGCNCHGHSDSCHFDGALFEATGGVSGGVCDDCRNNRVGPQCERCRPFLYQDPQRRTDDPQACIRTFSLLHLLIFFQCFKCAAYVTHEYRSTEQYWPKNGALWNPKLKKVNDG